MIVKPVDSRGIVIDAKFPDGSEVQFLTECTPEQLLQLAAFALHGIFEAQRRIGKVNSLFETLTGMDDEL
jgi:hypothetical protein